MKKPIPLFTGQEALIYKVILPTGEQGVAGSVLEALECATNQQRAAFIMKNRLFWEPYQTVTPPSKRTAPVVPRAKCYEQCLVRTKVGGDVVMEVYRATNYQAIKIAGHPVGDKLTKKDIAKLKKGKKLKR